MCINFLLRNLKLSALSCALVLTAFNAGQAMESKDSKRKILHSINSQQTIQGKYLKSAKIKYFDLACNIAKFRISEDKQDLTNKVLDVGNTMSNLIKNVEQTKNITGDDIREQIEIVIIPYLNYVLSMFAKKEKNILTIMELCSKIKSDLIQYIENRS